MNYSDNVLSGPLSTLIMEAIPKKTPTLAASTVDTYCCSVAESKLRENIQTGESEVPTQAEANEETQGTNYFKSLHWYRNIQGNVME